PCNQRCIRAHSVYLGGHAAEAAPCPLCAAAAADSALSTGAACGRDSCRKPGRAGRHGWAWLERALCDQCDRCTAWLGGCADHRRPLVLDGLFRPLHPQRHGATERASWRSTCCELWRRAWGRSRRKPYAARHLDFLCSLCQCACPTWCGTCRCLGRFCAATVTTACLS